MRALYRLLLLAYPGALRRRCGRDMTELLDDLRREARRRRGRIAAAAVIARTIVELPFSAWRAHRAAWQPARHWTHASAAAPTEADPLRDSISRPRDSISRPRDSISRRPGRSADYGGTTPTHPPGHGAPRHRGLPGIIEVIMQTLRYTVRNLRNSPAFAAIVVLTLGLGIGANTVVFSVVDGVLLSPLPYEHPDRLVRLYQIWPQRPDDLSFVAGAAFREYRELDEMFDGVGALYTYSAAGADIVVDGEPERILVMPISAGTFAVLGVDPLMGREFRRDEERDDAGVAIISHALWQRYFGGDPGVIGKSFELGGVSRSVVGVMPAGFRNPIGHQVDAWVPEQLLPLGPEAYYDPNNWDNHYLSVVARLREAVTIEQAHARLDSLVPSYEERYEDVDGQSARLVPLLRDKVGGAAIMLWVLMAAVTMVLLIACVNVASLFLARSAERGRELAIRAALGATRGRLLAQMLGESLLLGLAGGAAGLVLSIAGLRAVVALSPADLPRLGEIGIDVPMFAFAAVASVLTGLLFGTAPALRFSRPDIEPTLRQEDRGSSSGTSLRRMRGTLVVAEIAIALVLLFGAGLLTKSFVRLLSVDLGVRPSGVLTYEVHLPDSRYPTGEQRIAFYDALLKRTRAIEGVEAAGAVSHLPTEGDYHQWGMGRTDLDPSDPQARLGPNVRVIDGDYLAAMGIELLRGRAFRPGDTLDSPTVMLVNDVVAERLFPDREALGASVRLAGDDYEIVGVVSGSARDPLGTTGPDIYLAHDQYARNRNWSLIQTVRVAGDPGTVAAQLRAALRDLDPRLVLYNVRTMDSVIAAGVAPQRFAMALMAAFAGLALLLAAIGIYGVLSYTVAQRRREIGIRIALGADDERVRRLVLKQAAALTITGLFFGVAGSLALAGWLASLLFEVRSTDPLVLSVVAAALGGVGLLAGWLPARRATSVDPIRALRD